MNIKINIKQCECQPTVISKKEISEVQFKKKNMLYAPPTKDKKATTTKKSQQSASLNNNQTRVSYQQQPPQSPYPANNQQAQRKLLQEMSAISKNHMQQQTHHNTNSMLQKQNQILQQNQRTIHHMLANQSTTGNMQQQRNDQDLKRAFQDAADKIARQVRDIKKMRDQILQFGETFKRTVSEGKGQHINRGQQQIGEMNSNLRNLVEVSKNHIEGLQNLQGIKGLQNFNIEAYTQAINSLKKQIVQYQKQSQTIQRQLKLRAAKLQKLQISPNFQQQLLQPYEKYLRKKAQTVDLHSLRQKVYEKLGQFDYGKFQTDVMGITNQVKSEMNDFYITCKQFRIDVPDIRIDKKELKQLDLNLPSVLDQYKQSKGIVFKDRNQEEEQVPGQKPNKTMKDTSKQLKETSKQPQRNILKRTSPQPMLQKGQIYTKPVDYSKSTKLKKLQDKQYKTVLQTVQQQRKKQVIKNVKKPAGKADDDFQKYLQNRAREQLAAIMEEKMKKIQQKEKELYEMATQSPKYELSLNLKNKVEAKKVVERQEVQRQQQEAQYQQEFEQQFEQKVQRQRKGMKRQQPVNKQRQQIKNIGTQVLREKLKNLFSKDTSHQDHIHPNRLIPNLNNINQLPSQSQQQQMTTLAQGFVTMINNTLTQVNTQLSQSIQKKIQNRSYSVEKRSQFERKSPNKITVPKLEEFRAPPVFNMQVMYEPQVRQEKKVEKKIVAKDYNYLRIQEDNNQLEISSISDDL